MVYETSLDKNVARHSSIHVQYPIVQSVYKYVGIWVFYPRNHCRNLPNHQNREMFARTHGAGFHHCLNFCVCDNPRLTLCDDRAIHLLHAESANRFLFTYDTSFPRLFNQRSLVVCCPLLLVALEVRHSEPGAFKDKRDHHEDQAEDQREAQLVGGVL